MKTNGTIQSIHDMFDSFDEFVNFWMLSFALTPDERQQLHQMLAEHHDHLADTINDGGTYDILQGGSGVPPLNNPSDQPDPSDDTVAVIDLTTSTLSVQVRVSPCLSVSVCNTPDCETHIDY